MKSLLKWKSLFILAPLIKILLILLVVIPAAWFIIIIASMFTLMLWGKVDSSTSLTYYESDSFYWLPYNFTEWEKTSIFEEQKYLEYDNEFIETELERINNKVNKFLSEKKVSDYLDKDTCKKYCDNYLSEVITLDVRVLKSWQLIKNFDNVINSDTGKEWIHYLWLKIIETTDTSHEYVLRVYDYLDEDSEDSILQNPNTWKNSLYLKQKSEQKQYVRNESSLIGDFNAYDWAGSVETTKSTVDYIDEHFFSHSHLIEKIWRSELVRTDPLTRVVMIETLNEVFNEEENEIKKEIGDLFKKIALRDSERIYDSALIDMMNFTWIKSAENSKVSLSNQYILSNEKINLDYFNKVNFWKDYKNIIINSDDFTWLNLNQAKRILNFKEFKEDSEEFGYYIHNDYEYNMENIRFEEVKKINNKNIIRAWTKFYSPDITYKWVTNWRSEYKSNKTTCNVIYPEKSTGDYVTYSQEALYNWQEVWVQCVKKTKNSKWETKRSYKYYYYNVPPLIQESEITYYKRFIFKDENKKSLREKDDYLLNYFYDKEYINNGENKTLEKISVINNIFLDKESIVFSWIYLKVKGYWIEISGDWSLVSSKKNYNDYTKVLPNAPVKFEIGILTDLNKENPWIVNFEEKNKINDIWITRHYLDKLDLYDKENTFFQQKEKSLYKENKIRENLENIVSADFYNKNKDDLTDIQQSLVQILFERELVKQKNSYLYTVVQDKKFSEWLDKLYNITQDTKQSEVFKKYLVLLSDITTDEKYRYLLENKHRTSQWFHNLFNANYGNIEYYGNEENIEVNNSTFDKCLSYNFLNDTVNNLYKKNDYLEHLWKDYVKENLSNICYRKYLQFKELNVSVNTDVITDAEDIEKFNKQIVNTIGAQDTMSYIDNRKLYNLVSSETYTSKIFDWTNANQLFNMLENKEYDNNNPYEYVKNVQRMNTHMNSFLQKTDNLDNLWELYKETVEYKDNCDINSELLLSNAKDRSFKCNLYGIYDEFFEKLSKNPDFYTFIKEEYLKESIQDEPFASVYDFWILDRCDTTICSNRSKSRVSNFVPYSYTFHRNKIPTDIYNNSIYKKYIGKNINNYTTLDWLYGNSEIKDYTYFYDLNKSFSFEEENYIRENDLNLHKVHFNPNVYLYSFVNTIKEKNNKYQITVYDEWFKWLNNNVNKKEYEKELLNDISNFLINELTNKKVIDDFKSVTNYKENQEYNIIPAIEKYSDFWAKTTVSNNINNYIDNVNLSNTINWNSINRDWLSNNDIHIKDNTFFLEWMNSDEKNILNKYFYAIYLVWLIEDHYKNNNLLLEKNALYNLSTYEDMSKDMLSNDIVWNLYKDVFLYNIWYMANDDINTWKIWWKDEVDEVLETKPEELYKLSRFYKENKDLASVKNAVSKLSNKNYKEDISSMYERYVYKNKERTQVRVLSLLDIKKEKVLLLEKYYNDFYWIIAQKNQEIETDDDSISFQTWEKLNTEDNSDLFINTNFISNILEPQLDIVNYLKDNREHDYYKYYLAPILDNKMIENNDVLKLKDIFEELKVIWIADTSYNDYVYYINTIQAWLPKDNYIPNDTFSIPLSKIDKNYSFLKSEKTSIENIRNDFINSNQTVYLPIYNILSDIFWESDTREKFNIINVTVLKKLETDILNERLKITEKSEKIKDIEEWSKVTDVFWKNKKKKEAVDKLEEEINWHKEKIKNIEKEISSLNEEELSKILRYKVSLKNSKISIEEIIEKDYNDGDITKTYNKLLFVNWPFSTDNKWFEAINFWSKDDTKDLNNVINSYLTMSFVLNNIRITEEWVKNIAKELSMYSSDILNKKVDTLTNFKNLWNFAPYYINNWYVNVNSDKKIKFELIPLYESENQNSYKYGWNSDYSIASLKDELNKKILNERFEQLKTEYCSTLWKSSDEMNCINYMDYLISLNISELKWEMDYIVTIWHLNDLNIAFWNDRKTDAYKNIDQAYYIPETYGSLAKKLPENSVWRKELEDLAFSNRYPIWQCTWYTQVLKDWKWPNGKGLWSGHGKNVWYNMWKMWYPTTKINPFNESKEKMMSKVQVGDIISLNWRISNWYCDQTRYAAKTYWHVWIIVDKDINRWTITIAESNVSGVWLVSKNVYNITKICPATLVHNVDWKY